MRILTCAALVAIGLTGAAHADAVEEALEAARDAYAAGDLSSTAAELTAASRAVLEIQAEKLRRFLPEAPSGWSREIEDTAEAGMLLSGLVGNTVIGRYDKDGESFTLTLTADSPMVAQMAGILANVQMMSMMGKVRKVNGLDMLEQDQSLSVLIGGRVLVQAQGMPSNVMSEVLERIEFTGLPEYDRQ